MPEFIFALHPTRNSQIPTADNETLTKSSGHMCPIPHAPDKQIKAVIPRPKIAIIRPAAKTSARMPFLRVILSMLELSSAT